MRTRLAFLVLAAACGADPAGNTGLTPATPRTRATLTVAAADWERLWHPPDAGAPPMPTMMMMMMMLPPGPPPQAALDACTGPTPGAACSFTDQGHALSGTCGKTPDGLAVCMPGDPGMMPPPDEMAPVLGGTLAGLSRTPLLVKVTPAGDRVVVESTNPAFSLEPADTVDGTIDLFVDHGAGDEPAGPYRRVNH